jgi:cis-L-3-hydroxyproline dehydratase
MTRVLQGRAVIPGKARGRALVSGEPLSFWGGYDCETGEIIDRRHGRCGEIAAGRVFLFPTGRGSSTASGILLQSLLNGTAPAALVCLEVDPILALGVIVAEECFEASLPLVVLGREEFESVTDDDWIEIEQDGTLRVVPAKSGGDSRC